MLRKVAPLVVSAMSGVSPFDSRNDASLSISNGKWARTVGSPPVRRMLSMLNRSTKIRAMRSISSKVRTSERSSHTNPSAGMQYVQRKLHRSVTEMRTSRTVRPC